MADDPSHTDLDDKASVSQQEQQRKKRRTKNTSRTRGLAVRPTSRTIVKKKRRKSRKKKQSKPRTPEATTPFKSMVVDWNQDRAVIDGETMSIDQAIARGYMTSNGATVNQVNDGYKQVFNFF